MCVCMCVQPKCTSIGKWIYKFRCTHTMQKNTEVKLNKVEVHASKWINPKNIMLMEGSKLFI